MATFHLCIQYTEMKFKNIIVQSGIEVKIFLIFFTFSNRPEAGRMRKKNDGMGKKEKDRREAGTPPESGGVHLSAVYTGMHHSGSFVADIDFRDFGGHGSHQDKGNHHEPVDRVERSRVEERL